MKLPDGLYDKLVTDSLARSLAELPDPTCRTLSTLPPEDASERIAGALADQLTHLLDELEGDTAEKAKRQLALVNGLLIHLRTHASATAVDPLVQPPQLLHAVHSGGLPATNSRHGTRYPVALHSRQGIALSAYRTTL